MRHATSSYSSSAGLHGRRRTADWQPVCNHCITGLWEKRAGHLVTPILYLIPTVQPVKLQQHWNKWQLAFPKPLSAAATRVLQ